MKRLEEKRAIVTGAAAGIGLGIARLFAEHGARVVLVDRDVDGVRAAARACGGVAVVGDVADPGTPRAALEAAEGAVDILVNNAGIMPHGDPASLTLAVWDEVMAINVRSMFTFAQAVIPSMLTRGKGSIINMSSVMATLTEPGYEAYTTSKAAVIGLTKALAVSYAARGLRCNCLCPGWVDTPLNQKLAEELGGIEALRPIIAKQQPTGTWATTREIAQCALFLASEDSSAVTGSALYCDGASSASI